MNIGFTGSREGMTGRQKTFVWEMLLLLQEDSIFHGHHGDCIGSDAQFHEMMVQLGGEVTIHPPKKREFRAFCDSGATNKWLEKDYLERDRDIVQCSDLLIATPKENIEIKRSGTWYTVRFAREKKIPTLVVYP